MKSHARIVKEKEVVKLPCSGRRLTFLEGSHEPEGLAEDGPGFFFLGRGPFLSGHVHQPGKAPIVMNEASPSHKGHLQHEGLPLPSDNGARRQPAG